MKLKELDESKIRDIGRTFGDYDYGRRKGPRFRVLRPGGDCRIYLRLRPRDAEGRLSLRHE